MEGPVDSVKQVVIVTIFGVYSGVMNKKYFAFLRRLQAKGRSNMYGAVPYLMRAFGLDRERAFTVVCEWMDLQAGAPAGQPKVEIRPIQRTSKPVKKSRKLVRARA
jgi:hypothetical protein